MSGDKRVAGAVCFLSGLAACCALGRPWLTLDLACLWGPHFSAFRTPITGRASIASIQLWREWRPIKRHPGSLAIDNDNGLVRVPLRSIRRRWSALPRAAGSRRLGSSGLSSTSATIAKPAPVLACGLRFRAYRTPSTMAATKAALIKARRPGIQPRPASFRDGNLPESATKQRAPEQGARTRVVFDLS